MIADPFASQDMEIDEVVTVPEAELLDKDAAFREYFVATMVDKVHGIQQVCITNGQFDAQQFERLKLSQQTSYSDAELGLAQHVLTHIIDKYIFPGQTEPLTYSEYYAKIYGRAWMDLFFYVMFYLIRCEQVRNASYIDLRETIRSNWEEVKASFKPTLDTQGFETVLRQANDQLKLVSQNEGQRMQNKRKPDEEQEIVPYVSRSETVAQLIAEYPIFKRYELYAKNVEIVARHTFEGYKNVTGLKSTDAAREEEATWNEELAKKPMTLKLLHQTQRLFESEKKDFKITHTKRVTRWRYWTMYAMNDLTTNEAGSDKEAWDTYLSYAAIMAKEKDVSVQRKPDFALKASLPSFDSDGITHNATTSLSARIDRLNDW
jgi:hypothetical protein